MQPRPTIRTPDQVVEAFIVSRVESVESALAGLTDDPLDDAEMLQAQLEVPPYAYT